MISATSPFKAGPRISEDTFVRVLEEKGSFDVVRLPGGELHGPWLWWAGLPAYPTLQLAARHLYRIIRDAGHDPAVWLAICGREHTFGTHPDSVLSRNDTRSWTNARSIQTPGVNGKVIRDAKRRSSYVKYESVIHSIRDGVGRVDKEGYAYRSQNAVTIAEVITIWIEDDPADYIAYVVDSVNEWMALEREIREMPVPYADIFRTVDLVDWRDQLAKNPAGGPKQRVALNRKRGLIVHYNGPPVGPDDRAHIRAVANYHANVKNWGSDPNNVLHQEGIAYHIAVADDGVAFLLRDIEEMLWHCGVTDLNRHALALWLPIGGSQRATPVQLETAGRVIHDWLEFTGEAPAAVRGHQEVSQTTCPGTLMADLVRPVQAGQLPGVAERDQETFTVPGYGTFSVEGPIYTAWLDEGGSAPNGPGFPISGRVPHINDAGDEIRVQWFERDRVELHGETVMFGRVGAELFDIHRRPAQDAPVDPETLRMLKAHLAAANEDLDAIDWHVGQLEKANA